MYRETVGIVIFNQEGKVLLGKRSKNKKEAVGKWQFPQGGIKKKKQETALEAASREMLEEVGLYAHKLKMVKELEEPLYYDYLKFKKKKNQQGQRMHWIIYFWEDSDLSKCDLNVEEKPEFDDIKFATFDELLDQNPVPFKVDM